MLLLYNLFLSLYFLGIRIYGLFSDKAKKWINGRYDWEHRVKSALGHNEKRVWIHCSSMGEFEQAKPIIEAIRHRYPNHKVVVTFFSPSGYEACKDSPLADYVFYLPHDGKRNAVMFINMISPDLAMFVKYEFWYHYLTQLKKQKIPTLLISGAFRPGQIFFKPYGGLFREMLHCFDYYFLQDEDSKKLLESIGINKNMLVSGDTRYDRVATIAQNVTPIPAIEQFKGECKTLIAGSTWPGDENVLKDCMSVIPADWKVIIVPHEIDDAHIRKVQQLFDNNILFTELDAENTGQDKKVLIVNNMGMLSRLYAYADIAFIGGGFQNGGIHNILEPAIFGAPVIFGPVFEKFVEAKKLVSLNYVFPVSDATACREILNKLITNEQYRLSVGASLDAFMKEHTGATGMIMEEINNANWLRHV